jgi:hypothetical protein
MKRKCNYCRKNYDAIRSTSKFCSNACRKKANRTSAQPKKTKLERRLELFRKTNLYNWFIAEARRAGTVEILATLTSSELKELKNLKSLQVKANGMSNGELGKDWHISHLQPVIQSDFVGTLHPRNLVLSPASYNIKRRNFAPHSSVGVRIAKSLLKKKYLVTREDSSTSIAEKISKILGSQLEAFLLDPDVKLTKNRRAAVIDKLNKLQVRFDINDSTRQLQQLIERLTCKETSVPSFQAMPASFVLLSEIERHQLNHHPISACLYSLVYQPERLMLKYRFSLEQFLQGQTILLLHKEPYSLFYKSVPVQCLFSCRQASFDDLTYLDLMHLRTPSHPVALYAESIKSIQSTHVDFF